MESPAVTFTLEVNGERYTVRTEPRRLLTDVLRHELGLSGTHVGCEQGVCGACTVLWDGEPVRGCLTFAASAEGHAITTIEGIERGEGLSPLADAFRRHHAVQCGYCTPGVLLTASALLGRSPRPLTAEAVREALSGNLCRCTGYQHIVDAILDVAATNGKG